MHLAVNESWQRSENRPSNLLRHNHMLVINGKKTFGGKERSIHGRVETPLDCMDHLAPCALPPRLTFTIRRGCRRRLSVLVVGRACTRACALRGGCVLVLCVLVRCARAHARAWARVLPCMCVRCRCPVVDRGLCVLVLVLVLVHLSKKIGLSEGVVSRDCLRPAPLPCAVCT